MGTPEAASLKYAARLPLAWLCRSAPAPPAQAFFDLRRETKETQSQQLFRHFLNR
jgi:hypothetical protein